MLSDYDQFSTLSPTKAQKDPACAAGSFGKHLKIEGKRDTTSCGGGALCDDGELRRSREPPSQLERRMQRQRERDCETSS
jgi:hypothetical protein